jgi:hypothetical protein
MSKTATVQLSVLTNGGGSQCYVPQLDWPSFNRFSFRCN